MIFGKKPKPIDVDGPYQDDNFIDEGLFYAQVYFLDEKTGKKWVEKELDKLFPDDKERLLDRLWRRWRNKRNAEVVI